MLSQLPTRRREEVPAWMHQRWLMTVKVNLLPMVRPQAAWEEVPDETESNQ